MTARRRPRASILSIPIEESETLPAARLRLHNQAKAAAKPPAPGTHVAAARAALATALEDTQQALDSYLASVADPVVLAPLLSARNAARAALAEFDAQTQHCKTKGGKK